MDTAYLNEGNMPEDKKKNKKSKYCYSLHLKLSLAIIKIY